MPGPHIIRAPACLALNEEMRPELIDFGTANLRAENIRQFKDGEASSRFGFTYLPIARTDGTSATAGYKVFSDKNSIVRITDTMQAEALSLQAQAWKPLGRVPECGIKLNDVPSVGAAPFFEDMDATNGYIALSWFTSSNGFTGADAYLAVIDQVTGSLIRGPEIVGTSTSPAPALLAVQGNYFIAVRYSFVGTKLDAFYLDTTSPATIATGWVAFGASIATDIANSGFQLQSLPHASTPRVAVIYINTSGGTDRATCKTFNVSGVVQTKTIPTSSVTPAAVGIGGNATDTLWFVWNEGFNIRSMGVSPFTISSTLATVATLTATPSPIAQAYVAPSSVTGKARICVCEGAGNFFCFGISIQTSAGATALDGAVFSTVNVTMCRKPFFYNGRYYSAFYGGFNTGFGTGNLQSTFFICDWTDFSGSFVRPIANLAPGLASEGFSMRGKFVMSPTNSSVFYVGLNIKKNGIANGSSFAEVDFASTKRWITASWGNATYLSGGLLSYYDGARIAEAGFLMRPTQPTTALSAGGVLTGAYRYVAVYEEIDANGNWCVSGVSDPSAVLNPAGQKVTVSTATLSLTARSILGSVLGVSTTLRVAFYRTLAGGTAPYYRLDNVINGAGGASAAFTAYLDNISDAVLATHAKLYAQPGVVGTAQDRRAPPFFSSVVSHNGMLVGASGSDVWFSGQNVAGEAAWFNPIFQIPIPGAGDITSLAVMDGSIYVFKRREVYILAGDAPSDNGATGGLGLPRRLACDVGSIESRATCTTALGIFFQSERGIEILTRAQSVEWIGAKMWVTVLAFPICTSITVEPISNSVIVELAAAESAAQVTGGGRTLIYDLSSNVWVSTDRRHSALALADCPSQSACVVYNGSAFRYAWLSASGYVHVEDRTTYLDADGTFVVSLIETGWYNAYQNEQRGRTGTLIFQRFTPSGITVETAYDYGDYNPLDPASNAVWTEAQTVGQRQLEFAIKPRGETMKFRITATAPVSAGTGQGISFFGVVLDLGEKQGPTRGTTRLDPALRR